MRLEYIVRRPPLSARAASHKRVELRQRFLTANGIQHPPQQRQNNQRRNLWQTQLEELIPSSVLLFTLNPRKARRTRFPAELLLPQFGQSSISGLAQCGSGFEDLSKVGSELDFGDRVMPGENSVRADNNAGEDHRGGHDPSGDRFIRQRQTGRPFQADAGQIRLLWMFASGWKACPTRAHSLLCAPLILTQRRKERRAATKKCFTTDDTDGHG